MNQPARKPGRPANVKSEDNRLALICAARTLMSEREPQLVSSREIATQAGVSQALINYYFGSKHGLYEAMLEDTLGPIFARLQGALWEESNIHSLRDLMESYSLMLGANPWVPRLIMREVLSEQGRFRERFIRLFANRGSGLMTQLLKQADDSHQLRQDLDISLSVLSWLSLAIFPFIAMPVASQVFGLKSDPETLKKLARHNYELYMRGILDIPDIPTEDP